MACATCHTRPTGAGTNYHLEGSSLQPFPIGPNGERHALLVSVDGLTNVTIKVPELRNLYERTGFNTTQLENTAGFGYLHDGSVDSIERFVNEPVFNVTSNQQTANLVAFLLCFSGVSISQGSPKSPFEPPGPPSRATHTGVGTQVTLAALPTPAQDAVLDAMLSEADQNDLGVVVKGRTGGLARGWFYQGAGVWRSDRAAESHTRAALEALAAAGGELTFTAVPKGSERRIGVDRDRDHYFDRDELDVGSDPADPGIRPKHRTSQAP